MLSKGIILIFIAVGVFLALIFTAEILECFFARRLSWNRLSWKDFESFQYSENQWNVAGMVFLAIRVLAILAVVAIIVVLFKFIPSPLNEFKDIFSSYKI